MHPNSLRTAVVLLLASHALLGQASFPVFGRDVQMHGFFSQGFVRSNQNNYLTMMTSRGSAAFSDVGLNISTQFTDKFRMGAQVYSRNVGQLGNWVPLLDYAYLDYRLDSRFGIRAGRVKTPLGLYTSTQDADFLRPWALLPQSVYPTDLRSITIAHDGLDLYGSLSLGTAGSLGYAAYAGARPTDRRSGMYYQLQDAGWKTDISGSMAGADLRWNSPLKGLMIGLSQIFQREHSFLRDGILQPTPVHPEPLPLPDIRAVAAPYRTTAVYADYELARLHVSSEYRRTTHAVDLQGWPLGRYVRNLDDSAWFGSVSYRVNQRVEVGTYNSRYYIDHPAALDNPGMPPPAKSVYHIFDHAVTLRLDLAKFWNLKMEGHFMDGTGDPFSPHGFHVRVNGPPPYGTLQPTTNFFILRSGWDF